MARSAEEIAAIRTIPLTDEDRATAKKLNEVLLNMVNTLQGVFARIESAQTVGEAADVMTDAEKQFSAVEGEVDDDKLTPNLRLASEIAE